MGTSKFPVWWEMDEKGKIQNYMSSFYNITAKKTREPLTWSFQTLFLKTFPPIFVWNAADTSCRHISIFSRPFSQFFIAYTKGAKHKITFFLLFKTDSDRFYVCTASVTIKQAAVTLAWLSLGDCVISREPLLVMAKNICTWWSGNLEMAVHKCKKANYNGPLIRKEYYFFVFMWNLLPFVWN